MRPGRSGNSSQVAAALVLGEWPGGEAVGRVQGHARIVPQVAREQEGVSPEGARGTMEKIPEIGYPARA